MNAVAAAPESAPPIDAVAAALDAAGALFEERRPFSLRAPAHHRCERRAPGARADQVGVTGRRPRRRSARRGVDDPAASLTAEAGIAVFRVAFGGGWRRATSEAWPISCGSRSAS